MGKISRKIRTLISVDNSIKSGLTACFLVVFVMLSTPACNTKIDNPKAIQAVKPLTIVTRTSPTTYFEDKDGANGFDYLLAQQLAAELKRPLKIIKATTTEAIFQALESGEADMAAAGLSITEQRKEKWRFSQSYFNTTQVAIYHRDIFRPEHSEDFIGKRVAVRANSSHAERLQVLKRTYPELSWTEFSDITTQELLDKLNKGEIDILISNSNEFLIYKSRYPRLDVAFNVSPTEQIAWVFDQSAKQDELFSAAQHFLSQAKADGTLDQLSEMFYGHLEQVHNDGFSTNTFAFNVRKRLPVYEQQIKQVAKDHGLDWRLIAAISYQESHWRPKAKSPTGVRGMMMLTRATAAEMGIENRLDAEQSLIGGASYFIKIHKRIPEEIKEPDRTWFALAAYNVGWGHVMDAQKITEFQGDDPKRWVNVKARLPLLSDPEWYRFTTYGKARGSEPVTYVQGIRHYYELLTWYFPNADSEHEMLFASTKETTDI